MPKSSERERVRRRHRLFELLSSGFAGTQDDIVRRLARDGVRVTQATVSRDLEDLGAVKRRQGSRVVYTMPETNGPPVGLGVRMLPELVVDAVPSGNLVVIKSYPGMGPFVAAVIDRAAIDGVIGTVQGDDTVLVVAAEGVAGKTLAKRIAGLGTGGPGGVSARIKRQPPGVIRKATGSR
jgi:transcriptional regulator of arginine metabolism